MYHLYGKYWQAIFVLLISLATIVSCRRHFPLAVEESEFGRRNNRPTVSECQFGKTLRELGSTWFADLGPPFGVMYCIQCECVAVPKKRRIVSRVQCRNIKKECPPALCDDPIVLPGKCCKTCPSSQNDTNIALDVPKVGNNEEDERNMKHFAALLTGRTSFILKREEMKNMYNTYNPHNVVATARFLFHRKNLYYSFYTSAKIGRPTAIQFVDDGNRIIEEHQLQSSDTLSVYQNLTGKVCGVWRRVPRDYKRLLREERLHIVLIWGNSLLPELALAGKIAKYASLQTEMFSSLMEPSASMKSEILSGAGGTAILSINNGAASSLHITLLFNGIFTPDDYSDVPIYVRIEFLEKKEIIFEEPQRIRKVSTELNVLELSTPISKENLRSMARGKLMLTVESKKNSGLSLQGHILTRASCEIFQTLLSPNNDSKKKGSGLAWLFLNRDGSLSYNIETEHVNSRDRPEIYLTEEQGKRKNVLEDLSSSFNFNQAIGIIDKVGPKVLESLYTGDLGVSIGVENEPNLIKGRLISRPVADARDSVEPILLKRSDNSINVPNHAIGMAWMAVDNECSLHYEITLSGFQTNSQDMQIVLEEKPIEAIGAPITRKNLDEFTGQYMEGFVLGMPSNDLVKLETSVCYLEIRNKNSNELLLRGKLKSTKVPRHCYPTYSDNNVPNELIPGDTMATITAIDAKCYHSGRFYNESEQWRNSQETCQMCACQRGKPTCETIKCPIVNCKGNEEQVQREGECCTTCLPQKISTDLYSKDQSKRGCHLGNQFHLAGATWHPYLPPNGFDICTTCTCDALTLEIRCPRAVCPPLHCSEKEAYRPDKKACCKVCPEIKRSEKQGIININLLQDQGITNSNQRIIENKLSQGACRVLSKIYENGQEWHPILASHGEQKCIKCRCKDAKVSCDRKRCTRSICQQTRVTSKRKIFDKNINPEANIDECCLSQCKRSRRHHKKSYQLNKHLS